MKQTHSARAVPAPVPAALAPVRERGRRATKNPAALYLSTLAPGGGQRTMRGMLEKCAAMLSEGKAGIRTFPWAALRYEHMLAIRSMLAAKYAASSANTALAALRGVLKNAFLLGAISGDDYQRAKAVPPVKGSSLPAGRALDAGELRALFEACSADPTPAGARDSAAFALMFGAGLRRAEACTVSMDDFCPVTGALKVTGKGNKQRQVFLTNGGRSALDAWLESRGTATGAILCPVSQRGEVQAGKAMTAQALMMRLRRRCRQAGIAQCSPHDLRRSFVSGLLDAGADLAIVQRLAGHASPTTTSQYDRRGEDAARTGAGLLHVPYVAPSAPSAPGA